MVYRQKLTNSIICDSLMAQIDRFVQASNGSAQMITSFTEQVLLSRCYFLRAFLATVPKQNMLLL